MSDWFDMTGVTVPDRLTMLVYGASGTGKTRFASTWPEVLFFDFEGGMSSIDRPVARVPQGLPKYASLTDALMDLRRVREGNHPFKTVVVDSLGELQKLCIRHVIDTYPLKRTYDNQPTLADFGKAFEDFEQIVRTFLALPTNVVLTAHVNERSMDTDLVKPLLQGKNGVSVVTRLVDMIGYSSIQSVGDGPPQPVIAFNVPQFVTKDRTGKMPQVLVPSTWDEMQRWIRS